LTGDDRSRDHVGGQVDDLRPGRLQPSLTPLAQAPPDVVGVDLQGVADVLEREQPGAVARVDPFPGFLEDLRSPRIAGVSVLLEAVDRILEDRKHEQPLTLESAGTTERRKVLGR
jgi:hypothetical protein